MASRASNIKKGICLSLKPMKNILLICLFFTFSQISCRYPQGLLIENEINIKTFGAVADDNGDDTKALQDAFNYCFLKSKTLVLNSGQYIISGPIINSINLDKGNFTIKCIGNVIIKMADNARYDDTHLIYLTYHRYGNFNILGDSLTLDLKDKLSFGIRLDALGYKNNAEYRDKGGYVEIKSKLTIKNVYASEKSSGRSAGIIINGVFDIVNLENTSVISVGRHVSFPTIPPRGKSTDEAKGIAIVNLKGKAFIKNAHIEHIYTHNDRDADGIAVFGYKPRYNPRDENYTSMGSAVIFSPTIIDAQGRGIKIQCSDVKISKPYFLRQKLVSILHGNDIDFQWGNGYVENSVHEYKMYKGINPIQSKDSYNCIVFQNKLKDAPMQSVIDGALLKSDVPVANFVALITGKDASSWSCDIKNVIIEDSKLSLLNRSFAEMSFNRDYGIPSMKIVAFVHINLNNVKTQGRLLSYTGYDEKGFTQKINASFNGKDLLKSNDKRLFQNLSGNKIME